MKKPRPSDLRRAKLKEIEAHYITPKLSNMIAINRYYIMASKILDKFKDAVAANDLDNAYVFGIRFAKFSTEGLPTHDYYNSKLASKELKALKKQNQTDLMYVIETLEHIVEMMDFEELEKKEIQRREQEALKKMKEQEERFRKQEEERKAKDELYARLNALNDLFPSVPKGLGESQIKGEVKQTTSSLDLSNIRDELPPPIPMPSSSSIETESLPPPPSYSDVQLKRETFSKYEVENDSTLQNSIPPFTGQVMHNPLAGPLIPVSLEDHGRVENKIPILPFETIKRKSKQQYRDLTSSREIQVFHLDTYQGRNAIKDSTNGCTVISPLVAVWHLGAEGPAISDNKIENIIDEIAPMILTKVRQKLGLSGHALIIPSDVHDYMVDEKILRQEMFVGVCGGNILDPTHVNDFLNLLENGEDHNGSHQEEKKESHKKVAAALFFHEHVVSILKTTASDGSTWYDLVDSLPTRVTKDGVEKIGATRTRCKDRDGLQILLHHYACEKFSAADAQYMDNNEWDDYMCDLDPRVFQGFVWRNP